MDVATGNPRLSLILPAFNEAGSIVRTLGLIQEYLDCQRLSYEILVSADGTDGTREAAAAVAAHNSRIHVFGSPERRGKGHGIRQGVARARGETIGFADADYKTPIEELAKVLPWLNAGYDVVIGSRGLMDTRIEVAQPLYRRIGSKAFGLIMHSLVGLWEIRDTQCGFKFFRAPVARRLFGLQQVDGYMFDVEVLHLAERCGYRIKEVGVRWRNDGDSRLELFRGNLRNAIDLLKIRRLARQALAHEKQTRTVAEVTRARAA
jgi:dolichyl-phosphate beta-glucosyltransferase